MERITTQVSLFDAKSINSFKKGLERIRKVSMGYFMDWLAWSTWPFVLSSSEASSTEQVRLNQPGMFPGIRYRLPCFSLQGKVATLIS